MRYVVCALQVTFQLARVLTDVRDVQKVPRRIAERLADGRDIGEEQMFFSITRQPLEWILRQVCTQCRSVSWSLSMDVSCIACRMQYALQSCSHVVALGVHHIFVSANETSLFKHKYIWVLLTISSDTAAESLLALCARMKQPICAFHLSSWSS
jgi:hypothetical protein